VISCCTGVGCLREEVQLVRDLLTNYDTAVRPVRNLSDVVHIGMNLVLFQIRDLVRTLQFLLLLVIVGYRKVNLFF
jgi:hypothetical protein